MAYSSPEYKAKKWKEAKAFVEEQGYTMVSTEWMGFRAYYDMKCPKGHDYHVQWANFYSKGTRCRQCFNESIKVKNPNFKGRTREEHRAIMDKKFKKSLMAEEYSFDDSQQYVNNQTKFLVTCPDGHEWTVNWNSWSSGNRCYECRTENMRVPEEEVRRILEEGGCEYLEGYKRVDDPFKYRCSCGNISFTRLKDFRAGVRCARCAGDRARITLRAKRVKALETKFGKVESHD